LERLSQAQAGFQRTGGLHAAAWFDQSGRLLELCEDVGRHNAFDKMVGLAMRAGGVPLSEGFVVLSGRAGYELIQKAAQAGVAIVCAIGAPSSLAIEFAHAAQMTLIGFARPDRMNVYCHAERLKFLGRGMG
jgi:FdhD protein